MSAPAGIVNVPPTIGDVPERTILVAADKRLVIPVGVLGNSVFVLKYNILSGGFDTIKSSVPYLLDCTVTVDPSLGIIPSP